jgi:hypothetical protein
MPNFDETTGIRYGVISPHSISSFALDDIYNNGTDTICESGKQELLDDIKQFCEDHYLKFDRINTDSFEDQYYEHYENSDGQMDYSDNEYTLHVSGDNFGIFVMRSPYYTYCRGCSPCAPGAGDLDSPMTSYDGPISTNYDKALCLAPDWFDKEESEYSRKIPYRVFRVDNDQEVI